jgi:para-nitrobenzyl esterase
VEQGKYGSSPVFLFMYSRVHPYIPGVAIADQDTATIGAYHTSDVPYWFGTQDALNLIRPTRQWTAYDRQLSKQMTDALIAFAKTGDPNTAAADWPKWKRQSEQLIEFGDAIKVVPMNASRLNFMAAHSPAQATRRAARD